MVSASPESLARLSRLVSGDAGWHRMACLHLDGKTDSGATTDPAPSASGSTPDALAAVERFRASASPTAQRLAAYLAAVPLTLPVMTLVRRSLLPGSEHGHLAEVALGGLFKPWGTTTAADALFDDLTFEFLPDVRDVLLGSQRRGEVAAVRELGRVRPINRVDQRRIQMAMAATVTVPR